MAGLGKYKKGAKFTLKSGNKPTFKAMGSSPAKISGIGARVTGTQEEGEFVPDIDYRPTPTKVRITDKDLAKMQGKHTGDPTAEEETIEDATKVKNSPNNLNNFGIGPGGSPWKQDDDKEIDENVNGSEKKDTKKVRRTGGDIKPGKDTKAGDVKEPGWVKALKIGTTLLSGGIQGVYGGTREEPKINWGKWTQEELDEAAGSKIASNILKEDIAINPHTAGTPEHAEWEKKNKEDDA